MRGKKKKVIFIYEGVKAEEKLLSNLAEVFFSSMADVSILNCPAEGNIYMLWSRLKKDDYFIHNLNQEELYIYQKNNYICNGNLLCILNSVPLFLLEYFQEDFWNIVTAK